MKSINFPTWRGVVIVASVTTLAGCAAGRGGSIPYSPVGFKAPDINAPALIESDYRIAPLDKLSVRVFKFDDLTGDYDVDLMGNLTLPLIGSVKAVNLTPAELKTVLVQRYGEKYVRNPDISVGIKESAGSAVTVQGSVRQPGLYPLTGSISLMQAVATARGLDDHANPHRVAIFRTIDGKRMAAAFDLQSIQRGEAEDPRVYRGDIVVVDGGRGDSVFGKILQTLPLLTIFRPF